MIHVSSAMAGQFAFASAELTAEVKRLGPNPLRNNGAHPTDEGNDRSEEEGSLVTDASHN